MCHVSRLPDRYINNPYHNATHAADVLCRLGGILATDGLFQDGTSSSCCYLLSAIVAAMVHDYGHPGLNNDYQVMGLLTPAESISGKFNENSGT